MTEQTALTPRQIAQHLTANAATQMEISHASECATDIIHTNRLMDPAFEALRTATKEFRKQLQLAANVLDNDSDAFMDLLKTGK